MIVDIQGQGFTVTPALAEHMRRRLGFVLTRHGDRIRRVAIRVGDENGPRGGVDKYCSIQVHLRDAPTAVIKDVGAELYAVIDRAADRVGRVVVKHLDRALPARDASRRGVFQSSRTGGATARQADGRASFTRQPRAELDVERSTLPRVSTLS